MTEVVITRKMWGWSKHGGARQGIVKEDLDVWVCQICGDKQVRDLPQWMIPMDEDLREYIRVCSQCKHMAEKLHYENTYENFGKLMVEVRKLRKKRIENLADYE